MTVRARITQAELVRVVRSMKAAKIEKYRLVMHLERGEIEIIVGETSPIGGEIFAPSDWDDYVT